MKKYTSSDGHYKDFILCGIYYKKLNWNSLPYRSLGLLSRLHMAKSFFPKVQIVRRFVSNPQGKELIFKLSKNDLSYIYSYSKTLNFLFLPFPYRAQYVIHSKGLIVVHSNSPAIFLTTYIEKENGYLTFFHYN